MPVKKATAKHTDPKHAAGKDLRRAYEHLGRVEILQRVSGVAASQDIHRLVTLAEKELGKGHRNDAADLLRAAEHFSFAALASEDARPKKVSDELKDVVSDEVEHLTRRAKEHWDESNEADHHTSVAAMFDRSLEAAAHALDAEKYREALELARGAEALAHVRRHGRERLGGGSQHPKLPKP